MSLRIGGLAIVYGGLDGEPSYFSGTLMAFRDLAIQGFATNYLVADPKRRDQLSPMFASGLRAVRSHR